MGPGPGPWAQGPGPWAYGSVVVLRAVQWLFWLSVHILSGDVVGFVVCVSSSVLYYSWYVFVVGGA